MRNEDWAQLKWGSVMMEKFSARPSGKNAPRTTTMRLKTAESVIRADRGHSAKDFIEQKKETCAVRILLYNDFFNTMSNLFLTFVGFKGKDKQLQR